MENLEHKITKITLYLILFVVQVQLFFRKKILLFN